MDPLRQLAEQQHGVVGRAQCRALGIDVRMARRRAELEPLSRRVLRLVGAPRTPEAALMAAVLDGGPGAVASHRSAAALWGLSGFRMDEFDIVRPHGRDRSDVSLGQRLHRTRLLPAHHVTTVHGVPVTTPARTLFDLAALVHPGRLERAVDNAVAKSPGLLRALHRMLPELAERGRDGIAAMRSVLDARPMGYIAPASALEARVIRLLGEAGIAVRRQVDLGGDDWIGRVDLLVEGTNVVVEVDSARFHSSKLDRERDALRDEGLGTDGFCVVRVAGEDVWHAPHRVVQAVLAVLDRKTAHPWRVLRSRTGGGGVRTDH